MVDEPVATCGNCGELNVVSAAYCGSCGAQIVAVIPAAEEPAVAPTTVQAVMRPCERCGVATPIGTEYCFSCGYPAAGVMPLRRPDDHGQRAAIISMSVFASLALIAGLVIWLLVRAPGDEGSPIDGDLADVVTSVETGPLVTITTTTTSPAIEPIATTTMLQTPIGVTTTLPPADVVSTTVQPATTQALTTIPATTQPQTTAAQTTVAPTTVTPTTVTPTTVAPTTSAPGVITGDLGIEDHPITKPPCDEQYITIVASSISADTHVPGMTNALETYPDSEYLRTDQTCSSLRPEVDGEPIYVAYFGPFDDQQTACDQRADGPSDAYVRVLSSTLPDDHQVSCD